MKYTDPQIQAFIDVAFLAGNPSRYSNLDTFVNQDSWLEEAPNRLAIAKAFLGKLKPDPYAELKKAHAEGEVIQHRFSGHLPWNDTDKPEFLSSREYRIKPEPEPLTFEAHGKTWTKHKAGDPIPCDGKAQVEVTYGADNRWLSKQSAQWWNWISGNITGWRYADEQPAPETQGPNIEVSNPVQDMALGGQMYWRDLALQLAEVWRKCHSIGASLQHGDIDTDVSFTVCCELHGGRCFHAATPSDALAKAIKWLVSPDRENFPALDAVKEVKP